MVVKTVKKSWQKSVEKCWQKLVWDGIITRLSLEGLVKTGTDDEKEDEKSSWQTAADMVIYKSCRWRQRTTAEQQKEPW